MSVSPLSREEVTKRIRVAERGFLRAYEQVEVIQRHIASCIKRLDKADSNRRQAFTASIQLRLTVSEGILAAYVQFASLQMETIARLQTNLLQLMPSPVTLETDEHMLGYNSFDDVYQR
jgi:hypothetical protein